MFIHVHSRPIKDGVGFSVFFIRTPSYQGHMHHETTHHFHIQCGQKGKSGFNLAPSIWKGID